MDEWNPHGCIRRQRCNGYSMHAGRPPRRRVFLPPLSSGQPKVDWKKGSGGDVLSFVGVLEVAAGAVQGALWCMVYLSRPEEVRHAVVA